MNQFRAALSALVLALAAAGCGGTSTAPSSATPTRHVVVLGDSLAVTPNTSQSFPSNLEQDVQQAHLPWVIDNAGVSGDTTSDGLRRYEALLTSEVGVLVLELGANDGLRGQDVSVTEENLGTIIQAAQAQHIRVLLCGMETPPLHGLDYSAAFHNIFPRVATRYGIPLVPFLLDGIALDPAFNGPDFIHPNAAGAQRIAQTVWPYLRPLLTS